MSSTTHPEGPSDTARPHAKRRLRSRLGIALLSTILILWQLNVVIWVAHGLLFILQAGQVPRAFLGTLLTHLYQAVMTTIRSTPK